MPYFIYILKCVDDSYYTGMTENLSERLTAHENGFDPKAYTYSRRPVILVWTQEFPTHDEAFSCERQIKGWNRMKKEALIRNDWDKIHQIVKDERRNKEKDRQLEKKES